MYRNPIPAHIQDKSAGDMFSTLPVTGLVVVAPVITNEPNSVLSAFVTFAAS